MKSNEMKSKYQYIDIGTNLTFDDFKGIYNGKQFHEPDLHRVIERAEKVGVTHIVLISTHLDDLLGNIEIIERFKSISSITFKTTIGMHPIRINQLCINNHLEDIESMKNKMNEIVNQMIIIGKEHEDKLCAIGEIGLDYGNDSDTEENGNNDNKFKEYQQCAYKQLSLLHSTFPQLPFLFHCKNAWNDFHRLNEELGYNGSFGVIHCFDGNNNELQRTLNYGWDIGVSCLSVLTEERIDTMKNIPLQRLHIETDSPFCDIKRTSAAFKYINRTSLGLRLPKYKPDSLVMRRNEPCNIIDIATIMSKITDNDYSSIVNTVYSNSQRIFFS